MAEIPKKRKELGIWGEDLASRYLMENGVTIINKNIRTPYGEIDLVGEMDGLILFVEVKTRRWCSYGFPEESVNRKKAEHMVNSASSFMQKREKDYQPWRIDVVSVLIGKNNSVNIKWFKNAISG